MQMHSRISHVVLALYVAALSIVTNSLPSLAATPTSAATEKQIASGIALYKERCVQCHSENLAGGAGPTLKGEDFVAQWEGKPLRALYSRIVMTMPGNDPGSLTPGEVLALVAYIANESDLATWKRPFASANELSSIIVVRSK